MDEITATREIKTNIQKCKFLGSQSMRMDTR